MSTAKEFEQALHEAWDEYIYTFMSGGEPRVGGEEEFFAEVIALKDDLMVEIANFTKVH